jgi:hypothetical protein
MYSSKDIMQQMMILPAKRHITYVQGLLVEPNPFAFQRGLSKHRKAYQINTCLSILPRTTFLPFE